MNEEALKDKSPPGPKPKPIPRPRTRTQTEGNRSTVTKSTDESSYESGDEMTVGHVLKIRTESNPLTIQ